jgi:hypothetical protein
MADGSMPVRRIMAGQSSLDSLLSIRESLGLSSGFASITDDDNLLSKHSEHSARKRRLSGRSLNRRPRHRSRLGEALFLQFPCERRYNQEHASGLKQRAGDVCTSVVTQPEPFVLQQPTERALDRPADPAQSRTMRPPTLVDEQPRADRTTGRSTALVVVTLVGERVLDPLHRPGSGLGDVRCHHRAGHGRVYADGSLVDLRSWTSAASTPSRRSS